MLKAVREKQLTSNLREIVIEEENLVVAFTKYSSPRFVLLSVGFSP
jgi:hypothetical protein